MATVKTKPISLYVPFARVERQDGECIVEGYAFVNEVVPGEGGIRIKRSAMEAATAEYMKFANIREMHGRNAAGVALSASWDDTGCLLRGKIVDPVARLKVEEGVYKGYSIGVQPSVMRGKEVEKLGWVETSLVDRPKDPDALFTAYRADGFDEEGAECEVIDEPASAPPEAGRAAIEAHALRINADFDAAEPRVTPEERAELEAQRAAAIEQMSQMNPEMNVLPGDLDIHPDADPINLAPPSDPLPGGMIRQELNGQYSVWSPDGTFKLGEYADAAAANRAAADFRAWLDKWATNPQAGINKMDPNTARPAGNPDDSGQRAAAPAVERQTGDMGYRTGDGMPCSGCGRTMDDPAPDGEKPGADGAACSVCGRPMDPDDQMAAPPPSPQVQQPQQPVMSGDRAQTPEIERIEIVKADHDALIVRAETAEAELARVQGLLTHRGEELTRAKERIETLLKMPVPANRPVVFAKALEREFFVNARTEREGGIQEKAAEIARLLELAGQGTPEEQNFRAARINVLKQEIAALA